MKSKPKSMSRPKKNIKSTLKKTPAVKAALLNKKKKPAKKTGKNKIVSPDNATLRKMEKELRETKQRLRLLSDASEEGIAVHRNGVIIEANDALARLFGYELSAMIGMHAKMLATPKSWKVIQKHIAQKYGKPYESMGVRKDGSTFICSLIGKPYKYRGRALRISVFRDITDRRRAEDELRHEERRFKTLAEQSSDIIVFVDRNGIVTYENPAVEKLLGLKPEERIGVNIFDRIHPDDLKFARDAFNTFIVNKSSRNMNAPVREIRLRHHDGSWRMFETAASKLLHNNIVESVFINLRDITERKQVEAEKETALEAVRESDLRFRKLSSHVPGMIYQFMRKPDGTYSSPFSTEAINDIFGCSPQDVHDDFSPIAKVILPEDLNGLISSIEYSAQNMTPWKHEYRVQIPGQPIKWLLGLSTPEKMADGSIIWHGFNTDITERKLAEEELKKYHEHLEELVRERTTKLEASNKELEAFSYSASHDLRAPLRSIDGFSRALLEDYENKLDIQGKDYLRRIREATGHMTELIDDLLQLSRITRTEINLERTNLSHIARFVMDELWKSQPKRNVEIIIADDLEETADSRLIHIVFENLLGNSWKFTGKQSQAVIEFGFIKDGDRKVYFVRDNGVGFNMAYADRLFAPFQRLHSNDEFPGTGIGLAIVQRIIHRHGGQVWLEGNIGEGATCYFTLHNKY
jgi:PAS domain S-box-containing protein